MKRIALALILILLLLSSSMQEIVIYASFVANQTYISDYLCVNRSDPSSDCNGKCQLQEVMQESNNEDKDENPKPKFEEKQQLNFVGDEYKKESHIAQLVNLTNQLFKTSLYLQKFSKKIFHPPK